jgi:hypothetical protein
MINRIIDDSKYVFKSPGSIIQMIYEDEKYIWLSNRYMFNFNATIDQLADKNEKTQKLKNLESVFQIELFLENKFAEEYKTKILKEELGIDRNFDTSTMPLKKDSITKIYKITGIDLSGKNLSEAYKIILEEIFQEEKINPPITKTFFDRLIKQGGHKFRYKIEDTWHFNNLEKIPDFVVGVGMYKFNDNKLYLNPDITFLKQNCSFELPSLKTDFGNQVLGTKIIYE